MLLSTEEIVGSSPICTAILKSDASASFYRSIKMGRDYFFCMKLYVAIFLIAFSCSVICRLLHHDFFMRFSWPSTAFPFLSETNARNIKPILIVFILISCHIFFDIFCQFFSLLFGSTEYFLLSSLTRT